MPVHDLDHAHKGQARGGADKGCRTGADAAPVEDIALNRGDIIRGGGVTDLIHIQPFVVVIKIVEFTMRKFLIPKIVEPDGDHGADGRFHDDGSGDASSIVMISGSEKLLGEEL